MFRLISRRQGITIEKQNTRRIQAYPSISRHNQAYSTIIQAYSEPCVTQALSEPWSLGNLDLFRTRLIFRTPWHIQNQKHNQNPSIFRTLGYSEPKVYSELYQTCMMDHSTKIVNECNVFHKI